jgi:hypothetical protein
MESFTLELADGLIAIFDAEDQELAEAFEWCVMSRSVFDENRNVHFEYYAFCKSEQMCAHNLVLETFAPKIKFLNGNTLDYRKSNLSIGGCPSYNK